MTVDQDGINFIKLWEGFEPKVYLDVAGKPTIGIGHLIKPSEDFSMGISLTQAEELLWRRPGGPGTGHLAVGSAGTITQNQTNALCSFGFNLGVGALSQMLSHGWDQVPQQILEMGQGSCEWTVGGCGRTHSETPSRIGTVFTAIIAVATYPCALGP